MTRCSNSLSVLVEELDDHQGSFEEAVSDVGWKTVETPDLPRPEEAPAPAPDHLLVAVTGVRHHAVIWNQRNLSLPFSLARSHDKQTDDKRHCRHTVLFIPNQTNCGCHHSEIRQQAFPPAPRSTPAIKILQATSSVTQHYTWHRRPTRLGWREGRRGRQSNTTGSIWRQWMDSKISNQIKIYFIILFINTKLNQKQVYRPTRKALVLRKYLNFAFKH